MNQVHNGTIIRVTKRKLYEASVSYSGRDVYVSSYEELVKTENLWSGELDSPVLEDDAELYIASLEEVVRINKVVRSTDNTIIYYTYDKKIDDEITEASRIEANKKKVQLEEEINRTLEMKSDYLQKNLDAFMENFILMEEKMNSMTAIFQGAKKVMNARDIEELSTVLNELNQDKNEE